MRSCGAGAAFRRSGCSAWSGRAGTAWSWITRSWRRATRRSAAGPTVRRSAPTRSGDLVAYDSADDQGRFAVELPIRYGENPVDFVAYGPFGEVREFNRTYRVLSELLPEKRLEYGLSAGQCRSAQCRGTGNIDLRYGVTRRLTVQGGVDQFWRDSLPNRTHPYAAVVLNPTN